MVVRGVFCPGFICYGIPIGCDTFVRTKLFEKVEEVAKGADKACEVLGKDSQALWTVLRSSVAQQLDYHMSLCYPSDMKAAAEHLDGVLWRVLECATRSTSQGVRRGWAGSAAYRSQWIGGMA